MKSTEKERFSQMTKRERAEYLAGGRVTAKRIGQMAPISKESDEAKKLQYGWKPRLRSTYLGRETYETKEEAIAAGKDFQARCKRVADGEEEIIS